MLLLCSFRTENEGWAVVPQSELFVTTFDYGYTWTPFTTPDSTQLYDIFFTDSITGYAVGDGGVIVKYKYQIPDYVDHENNLLITNFELNQNYPNPFNSSTTISYNLSEPAKVSIKIYNLLGNQVATLVEEYRPIGSFNVVWNANNQSSGVYYVQMIVSGRISTKKMILLK